MYSNNFDVKSNHNPDMHADTMKKLTKDLDLMGSSLKNIVTGIAGEISGQYQQFGYAPNIDGVYVRGFDGLDLLEKMQSKLAQIVIEVPIWHGNLASLGPLSTAHGRSRLARPLRIPWLFALGRGLAFDQRRNYLHEVNEQTGPSST